MGRLEGKVAFITGAARGLGRSHAVQMAKEGADIIAVDICGQIEPVPYALSSLSDLEETARLVRDLGRRVVIREADVRSLGQLHEAVEAGVSELGRLDAVVANAGIFSHSPFTEMSEEMWLEMIDINQHGVFRTCKATVPQLLKQGEGGSIIIISSTAGRKGFANLAHYTAAKHAVVGLMRSLTNELGQHFIRVNTIHPCSVNTYMTHNPAMKELFGERKEDSDYKDVGDSLGSLNVIPVPWVEPIDVSHAVVFLASDEARYITGATLPVDAGMHEKVR
jgi:(+)-trans-carveol dehydrogenase